MKYRIAQYKDLDACAECVAAIGYFDPVNFHEIGGIVLLAENEKGIQGVVWACVSGTLAYSDYMAVLPGNKGLAVKLMAKGVKFLRAVGVKQIRSNIESSNTEIVKIHKAAHAILDDQYLLSYLNIGVKDG